MLMRLLTDKEDLIEIGIKYLAIMAAAQIPQTMVMVLSGTIRAAGYKKTPFAITATGVWGVRVLLWRIVRICIETGYHLYLGGLLMRTRLCVFCWASG